MGRGRRIVIVGAGIVGASLADELTERGETSVTVVDRGPLFRTGGSTSHAPGLVSRTSPSRLLQHLADHTLTKLGALEIDGRPCVLPVGTVEVALNEDRLRELRRREGFARAWGWRGTVVEAAEVRRRWPLIRGDGLLGGYVTDGEGLVHALRAVEAQARRATERGARFVGTSEVVGFATDDGRVTGVRLAGGDILPADVVVVAAGVWGPAVTAHVGLTLPTVAMEHQYAVTVPIPQLAAGAANEATLPIVRHHDAGIYLRDHGDRLGIGSFAHAPMPVAGDRLAGPDLSFPFTASDFADAWAAATHLIPALGGIALEHRFNGVFSFTPDGLPLLGEHPDLAGFWVAEAAWVTHAVGLARAAAELLTDAPPFTDVAPADLARFERVELAPGVIAARCDDAYRDVYVPHHPAEPHTSARGLRFSPFAAAQRTLGAVFVDVAGWERPGWYEANAPLVEAQDIVPRDAWSSRHWSPIAVAEHRLVRDRGGLIDLTPLTRVEVRGPGAEAFVLRVAAGAVGRPPGRVTYTVMLDDHAGVRSDITVARLADDRYLLGLNGARDVAWLRRHAASEAGSVVVDERTDATCCLAVAGPRSRDVLAALATSDLGDAAFPYLAVRELSIGGVPVVASRISYTGELGWELVAAARDGERLWAAVWEAAQAHGLIAAGRAALATLRLEKGYRMTGAELSADRGPDASGLGRTIRDDGPAFIGRAALARRRATGPPAPSRLQPLVLDGTQVALGGEPVSRGDQVVGYVTSAGWGATVGRSIALAWLDASVPVDEAVTVRYLGDRLAARVVADRPIYDPAGARLRG